MFYLISGIWPSFFTVNISLARPSADTQCCPRQCHNRMHLSNLFFEIIITGEVDKKLVVFLMDDASFPLDFIRWSY